METEAPPSGAATDSHPRRSQRRQRGRRAAMLVGSVLLAGLALWLLWPAPALLVDEAASGRRLAWLPLGEGAVVVRYRHSLYDALTNEEFVVSGGELVLSRLSSERLTALEYYARAEMPVPSAEGYAINGLHERFAALDLLVGPVGQRTLLHAERVLPLYTLPAAGGRVRLRVGWVTRAEALIAS